MNNKTIKNKTKKKTMEVGSPKEAVHLA
jgi:hypothetical protein